MIWKKKRGLPENLEADRYRLYLSIVAEVAGIVARTSQAARSLRESDSTLSRDDEPVLRHLFSMTSRAAVIAGPAVAAAMNDVLRAAELKLTERPEKTPDERRHAQLDLCIAQRKFIDAMRGELGIELTDRSAPCL